MPPEPLTFSAYAVRRGWTQPYVSQLVKAGVIPLTPDRKIDPDVADAAIAEHRDPVKQYTADRHAADRAAKAQKPKTVAAAAPEAPAPAPVQPLPPPQIGQFQKAKTASEVFKAKNAELEYRERVGELVERSRYDAALSDGLGPILSRLESLSTRVVSSVPEQYVREVRSVIEREVDDVRRDIANVLRAMMTPTIGQTRQ